MGELIRIDDATDTLSFTLQVEGREPLHVAVAGAVLKQLNGKPPRVMFSALARMVDEALRQSGIGRLVRT